MTRLLALLILVFWLPGCTPRGAPVPAPHPSPVRAATAQGRALQADLSRVFGAPVFAQALVAAHVESLETGETLYELNAHKLVMPASALKIVTLAAFAERLGWEHRFETRLVTTAPIDDGILRGDLIVVGSGDPSFNARDASENVFHRWARELGAAGLRAIDGRIVADDRAFAHEPLGMGWSWDDLPYGFAAPGAALQHHENLVEIIVRPGPAVGLAATVEARPPDSGLSVVDRVITVAAGQPLRLDLRRPPGHARLEVDGAIPLDAGEARRTAAIEDPAVFFVHAFRHALLAHGIDVRGEAITVRGPAALDTDPPADLSAGHVLAFHTSPPLSEIGATLMKVSQNLYAETLLRALGARDGPATVAAGREAVAEVLASWGIPASDHVLRDGSGLSRYNYVTARMLVAVLRRMYADPRHRDPFLAAFPVAGRDGTLESRLERTRAEANARAKTGSMSNVRALAGYVRSRDGEPLAFAIIVNNFAVPPSIVLHGIDIAVEHLANFTRP